MKHLTAKVFALATLLILSTATFAQTKSRKYEFYFSWGYNTEWYTNSNVKISQPSLGNDYTFTSIQGHDNPGWNSRLLKKPISIPQYNYRLGMFINKKKDLAVEINFDHTKFIFADQRAHIKGTFHGKYVDSLVDFNAQNGYFYFLNNGANFLLFNIVKRWKLYETHDKKIRIDGLGKAGIGPVIPHVENSFEGNKNNPGFQFGGWNVGIEGDIKATFFNRVFVEYGNKLDYARYSNLKIYQGTAKHAFGTYEMILSLGASFPVGKKVN